MVGGDWPGGQVKTDDECSEIRQMIIIAKRLAALIERSRRSVRSIAREQSLNPQTIYNILNGRVWPDIVTVHRLELELGDRLWINSDLPDEVERANPDQFHRRFGRAGRVSHIGFIDLDTWEMEVSPVSAEQESWRWAAFQLTDEGWTREGEGTATDPESAQRQAEQHIAERVAAEASEQDKQPETSERPPREPDS